ncbi:MULTISPECIES: DUF1120 domain-containing protein [Leclercia]|uniref:DUF1120 domain-containing protein n=1 Tax=Leclercia TaxID=83654 RepID=UPI002550EA96|nr:DUF1120 domain-containing protein [Leclercia adecarboxylata]
MKHAFTVLFGLMVSLSASAGDSVSINFDVSAQAAACTPTLSHNGTADYGTRHVATLSTRTFTQIGTRDITLSIRCESATGIAITARDSRASSVLSGKDDRGEEGARFQINGGGYVSDKTRLFGLGLGPDKKPIGSYAVQIIADGVTAVEGEQSVSVAIGGSASKNGPWEITSLLPLPANQDYFYTFIKKGTSEPQPITSAIVPLQVSAAISPDIGRGQTVTLDGSAVISLVYL